jgi:multimeric flavodoxin WrbA
MKVLGIYGSPRRGGNSDILLDKALEGAQSAGAEIGSVYARKLKMSGCIECGGCDKTGKCVVKDDMQDVYPLLESADVILLATPIFFYGMTAQVKAIVDRGQAMWAGRMLNKTAAERKSYDSGKGYLIAVGATGGKNLFYGVEMVAKYFYDALDMSYEEGLLVRKVDAKKAIMEHSEELDKAFELGTRIVREFSQTERKDQ